jgi:hypothetical protein
MKETSMFNVYDKWSPLSDVVLGKSYSSDFFQNVKNSRIKSCLTRISDETEEDLLYFEQQLKFHGITVYRPQLNQSDRIENYVNDHGQILTNYRHQNGKLINESNNSQNIFVSNTLIPKPPLTPRDSWTVVDGDLLQTCIDHPSTTSLMQDLAINNDITIVDCWKEFGTDLSGGNFFQIGQDIVLGIDQQPQSAVEKIVNRYRNLKWHCVDIQGHNDGVYHPIKPGAILSLIDSYNYEDRFPGWDILYLADQGWTKVLDFIKLKRKNQGKWWLPGEEENDEFTFFVESWLNNWVGYVEETVFDVNCLVIDEKYICVNNYNQQVFEFLKKHNMEPIIIPFRHRYFWDSGLHCLTLEINRLGHCKKYI